MPIISRSLSALAALLALALAPPVAAQTTRAERTGYRETSTYADVLAFLDSLKATGAPIRTWEMAKTSEGRSVPVVLAARPLVASAEAARASGKPIVYLQANIHAGEVEGKEALQMVLRDLTRGPLQPLLDELVLLVVPIYNADGNERFAPGEVNRPGQNGPAVVGRRANGQGLDLNRDYVKLEAPESRGSVDLVDRWDPTMVIDLHTTNGSYHGYALTWAPGLNANVTPASRWTQDVFLPEVQKRMRGRHRLETFPYGNFRNQEPDSLRQGWETYDGRARYGVNWAGLRGRLAILSEAYSNDPFERRVSATYHFVHEILRLLVERRKEALALTRPGTLVRAVGLGDSVALRSELAPPRRTKVIAELTASTGQGTHGFAPRRRTGEFRRVEMPVWDRFRPTLVRALPLGYLVPDRLQTTVELLRRHGVAVTELRGGWPARTERFTIDSIARAPRKFEGHATLAVEGRWAAAGAAETAATAKGRWYYVSAAQPLGLFAAYLLEPESEDGLVTWNVLDDELRKGRAYPILRVTGPPPRAATRDGKPEE